MQILFYNPGQEITFFLETLDGYTRSDCISLPIINSITYPDLTVSSDGYTMANLSTGIYYFKFTLPKGYTAIGSYLFDVSYIEPGTLYPKNSLYQIVVKAPYGNFGASIT